ncbi:transcription termination factor Rho [Corynebacterium sp.]|uniref:transcription termination factor Rho n=1 Tax=Corynebacterium sp. TaxID=1720 RepID=UPI0026DFAED8|nr:transcription termination factor Rho [Corynebacterium sp.]MDO5512787.1 transcription termination factor Rho [Corynebacterium sp.]
MTDTDTTHAASADLASLKLTELRKMAAEKGLKGVSGLRKGDLITAIQTGTVPARARAEAAPVAEPAAEAQEERPQRRRATRPAKAAEDEQATAEPQEAKEPKESKDSKQDNGDDSEEPRYESRSAARRARRNRARHNQREQDSGQEQQSEEKNSEDNSSQEQQRGQQNQNQNQNQRGNRQRDRDNDGEGRRGRRSRRNRRGRGGDQNDGGQQQDQQHDSADLQDVAGILDIVDNNVAFVRTTGYHAGQSDVFVPNQLIRRSGLRAGDAVTGKVKMGNAQTHGQGRNRQKANQLVSVDTVNGLSVEEARSRPEFSKLTPLYPNQRLRLETEAKVLTTRVIDLIMPIGKGQRALIVSPPKAGKTTILQNIANAIATNNPECHLMVVLVDERPEEVTDMQRSVNGEVIASTFDRPPSEHTAVAELAIERAKRLVEQGKDVVVLLDSITRLGRAYNNSSPASGRILSGGVDSNALYPPKRFLGAARNIENGGSLTIIATAMVETGSAGDTVIFEEFKGTGNAELKLDRKISERRVFPAVDVNPSGTRKDELLLVPEEARIMHKLRRILSALDPQQAIDLLIKQLKKTKSNGEFLMQVASSAPMAADKEEEDYS